MSVINNKSGSANLYFENLRLTDLTVARAVLLLHGIL